MPIVEATGLGAAVDYLERIGLDVIHEHERRVTTYALGALGERFGERLAIYGPGAPAGPGEDRGSAISFLFDGIHAHDVSQVLDEEGVCVRAGHHCAKPLMRVLGVPATTRASFYLYNDEEDVDVLVDALAKAEKFFGS
jgi:cysteine desulfurase/selenocysteine lyase